MQQEKGSLHKFFIKSAAGVPFPSELSGGIIVDHHPDAFFRPFTPVLEGHGILHLQPEAPFPIGRVFVIVQAGQAAFITDFTTISGLGTANGKILEPLGAEVYHAHVCTVVDIGKGDLKPQLLAIDARLIVHRFHESRYRACFLAQVFAPDCAEF
ncbi:hypothetical protein PpBr36_01689 [Pyricularia pennisetigena]|uniref:hypothetical protein n=1 Tax=Pyricularia pennisetigena TaxID=1578925 RepID=UPI00114F6911|nr:hypothetical protein PpBr36_01689 [Pyricularia pennisetigena]TLS28174.1 hypothetical protein PpBr36_01689 [Pyricularia pennisetigena]